LFRYHLYMPSRKLALLAMAFIVSGAFVSVWGFARSSVWLRMLPSNRRARGSVTQIVFVQGRVVLVSEASELFASDDSGRTWRALPDRVPMLAVANGHELWGAHGWPGYHERASAQIWRSLDLGETWSTAKLDLPERYGPALDSRLPAAFLNEPDDEPLLAMSDFQLVRPQITADSAAWSRVGARVPGGGRSTGTINADVTGRKHGRSIYVAFPDSIAFSDDNARTWSDAAVRPAYDAAVRCTGSTCYALLSQLGSEWSELATTEAGSNRWTRLRTFDVPAVAAALAAESRYEPVHTFGACAMFADADAIFVAGIVNAGSQSWGAVLRVGLDGGLTSVGGGVPDGLWVVERAPDGVLWAGGQGAYRLQGGAWLRTWSGPD
jgi:hypothetical protein